MDKRILIVDDEEDIRDILSFNLENAGYQTDSAKSAEEALEILSAEHCLILLDVMMEGMSGFKMAQILRNERGNDIPIIFLTAKITENDLLTGFSAGGDDYICKPFSVNEVIARVRSVLKRFLPKQVEDILTIQGVEIDRKRKTVRVDGTEVEFSKKEFEILQLLASSPGRIFSRQEIMSLLWTETPYVLERTVDVHIARIRSKLGPYKGLLVNKSRYGYLLKEVQ